MSPAAIDALIQLTEDPACSSQLEAAGPLPLDELEEAKGELSKAIKKAHVDLYVGDDDIVRKVAVELTIQPPEAADEKVELELELSLGGVNEEQSFSTPSDAKPLEALFKEAGDQPARTARSALRRRPRRPAGRHRRQRPRAAPPPAARLGGSAAARNTRECLQGAETTADLQKCASLLK